jgi:hypothetical protein
MTLGSESIGSAETGSGVSNNLATENFSVGTNALGVFELGIGVSGKPVVDTFFKGHIPEPIGQTFSSQTFPSVGILAVESPQNSQPSGQYLLSMTFPASGIPARLPPQISSSQISSANSGFSS